MKLQKITCPKNDADNVYNTVVNDCEFFVDENREAFFISYEGPSYALVYLSHPDESKNFFTELYFNKYNSTVKNSDVSTAYNTICAIVRKCNDLVPVFTRVGKNENALYYDLSNASGDVIKIDGSGVQKVKKALVKDLFFYNNRSVQKQLALVHTNYKLLDFVGEFFNIDENQRVLFAVYLCAAYIPKISHPILILEGEKGAGKTSATKFLSRLIHPVSKDVFVLPKSSDDLITVLSNNHFNVFDNIGSLKPDFCNVFCQASTGGTLIKRQLYSDNTEIAINIKRLVVLNGISMEISQSDMLDRAILIRLNRIDANKRLPDELIWSKFHQVLPSVLADVFDTISKALNIYSTLSLAEYPRMADFAKYGYAIAEVIEAGGGKKFLTQYEENIKLALESSIEENPLMECIKYIVNKNNYFKSSMTELLLEIKRVLPRIYIGKTLPDTFPQSANSLSRKLATYKHELQNLGITVTIGRATERYVILEKSANSTDDIVAKK